MTLSERFRECRNEAGHSQASLAKALKCGQSTIASIENGRNKTSGIIAKAAHYFKVEAIWLSEGKGPKRKGNDTLPQQVSEPIFTYQVKTQREKDISEIVELLHKTTDVGVGMILQETRRISEERQIKAKQTA